MVARLEEKLFHILFSHLKMILRQVTLWQNSYSSPIHRNFPPGYFATGLDLYR